MKNKILGLVFITAFSLSYGQSSTFKVVLDAGHGGNDFGAVFHGSIEKNIALQTALKVGKILEKDDQIEVIYTRKSDVNVSLQRRVDLANNSKGSLFVSLHCNATKNQLASGFETYVMGVTRNTSNLEVAKTENAVVALETDHALKYNGYDVKLPESIYGSTTIQEEYVEQSIEFAGKVQQFIAKASNNKNRGVKQAGLLLLQQLAMPGVLFEMGFLSNKQENKFLAAAQGQDKVAEALANAILDYKKEFFTPVKTSESKPVAIQKTVPKEPKPGGLQEQPKPSVTAKPINKGIVFKVQISASPSDLETTARDFKGLAPIFKVPSGKLFIYYFAQEMKYEAAQKRVEEAIAKGFDSAFIVAFKDGVKIKLSEAIK